MTTKKLTIRQKLLVAGTLFGMFIGAGNLIFRSIWDRWRAGTPFPP